jgi:hypothetical protein
MISSKNSASGELEKDGSQVFIFLGPHEAHTTVYFISQQFLLYFLDICGQLATAVEDPLINYYILMYSIPQ